MIHIDLGVWSCHDYENMIENSQIKCSTAVGAVHFVKVLTDGYKTPLCVPNVWTHVAWILMIRNTLFAHSCPFKSRLNDRNMPTQHIATLLVATCYVRLATVLRHVGCCWLKFERGQIWTNNTQHVAKHRNTVTKRTQHVALNNVAICCVDMLRSFGGASFACKRVGVGNKYILWFL